MRGGFHRALRRCRSPPRGKNVGLRGSAWHCFFLFCFVRSLRGKKKKKGKAGGGGATKGGEKGRVGGTSERNVMVEGGRNGWDKRGRDEMGWEMGPSKTRLSQTGVNSGVRAGKGAGPALNTSHQLYGDALFLLLLTGHTTANCGCRLSLVSGNAAVGTFPVLHVRGGKRTFRPTNLTRSPGEHYSRWLL